MPAGAAAVVSAAVRGVALFAPPLPPPQAATAVAMHATVPGNSERYASMGLFLLEVCAGRVSPARLSQ
jgi:hypothetical protein